MAPITDPSNIGLADIFIRSDAPAAHLVAWLVLALFVASLLAISDASLPGRRTRGRP